MSDHPIIELTIGASHYPQCLAAIADAPAKLYCRGDLKILSRPCIAVVGTRKATDYGTQVTRQLVEPIARAGMTIVSGLALGIDAVAHRAALDAGGRTVAVLGSGIDDATIGPRQNVPLAHEILGHDGLVLSEYPAGTPADKWTFPARNRIISGLSLGVVVTEAAIKSGALITARLAAEQGRDVFGVPGSIFWPRSAGPNYLIQNGAKTVHDAGDILSEFGFEDTRRSATVSTQDPVQQRIVAILDDGPAHLDTIIASSELSASQVMAALSRMELNGMVIDMGNGHYRIS